MRTGGRSTAQGALGLLWAKSPATLPIPGFRSVRHADDTMGALAHGALPPSVIKEIEALKMSRGEPFIETVFVGTGEAATNPYDTKPNAESGAASSMGEAIVAPTREP